MSLPLLFTHGITDEILCKNMFFFWYIWKTRNDNRFQRRTWTSYQIQQEASAHMNTHLDALKEQALPQLGTSLLSINNAYARTGQGSHQTTSVMDSLLVPFLTSIIGTRCYTDASTTPDITASAPKQAGLGIFIINTHVQPPLSIFLKATMQDSSSVIMAESAAMALVAQLLNQVQCHQATLLSDNQ